MYRYIRAYEFILVKNYDAWGEFSRVVQEPLSLSHGTWKHNHQLIKGLDDNFQRWLINQKGVAANIDWTNDEYVHYIFTDPSIINAIKSDDTSMLNILFP